MRKQMPEISIITKKKKKKRNPKGRFVELDHLNFFSDTPDRSDII